MLVDVNECDDVRHNQCEHTCVDTMTGFYCTCNDGFTLMSDRKACRGQRLAPSEIARICVCSSVILARCHYCMVYSSSCI